MDNLILTFLLRSSNPHQEASWAINPDKKDAKKFQMVIEIPMHKMAYSDTWIN